MFQLTHTPIDAERLARALADPRAGALSVFSGTVRNHNDGRTVTRLEYEAHAPLCQSEAAAILQEAQERFDILDAHCVHRVGELAIGDTAVWVGVAAAHRDAAFRACRFIIDQIKARLPIWKKEYYTHGDPLWVQCRHAGAACTGEPDTGASTTPASASPPKSSATLPRNL